MAYLGGTRISDTRLEEDKQTTAQCDDGGAGEEQGLLGGVATPGAPATVTASGTTQQRWRRADRTLRVVVERVRTEEEAAEMVARVAPLIGDLMRGWQGKAQGDLQARDDMVKASKRGDTKRTALAGLSAAEHAGEEGRDGGSPRD